MRKRIIFVSIAVVLAIGAAVASAAVWKGKSGGTPTAASRSGESGVDKVLVHGAWQIDIRSPDGTTLVHSYRFHNQYYPTAAFAQLLSGESTLAPSTSPWEVDLGDNANGPCLRNNIAGECYVVEPEPGSNPDVFETLSATSPNTAQDYGKLVLSGTAIAMRTGVIQVVATRLLLKQGTNVSNTLITSRTLPTAISVAQGQQILVTVKISFASAP